MNIEEIVTKAIPREDCAVKNAAAMHRRKELKKRIEEHVEEKIKERDKTKPFQPDLEYKGYPNKGESS